MKFLLVLLANFVMFGVASAENKYTKVFSMLGSEFDELEIAYEDMGYFSISIDNDGLTGADNYYTHGHLLSWGTDTAELYCKRRVPWGNSFIHVTDWRKNCDIEDQYLKSQSFFYGTQIHTPEDIKVLPEDLGEQYKPYAGWTFIGREVGFFSTTGKFKKYSLSIGCIGPCAAGDRQQRFIHDTSSNDNDPEGWDQQITNDIAIQYNSSGSWGEHFVNPNEGIFGVVPYWFNSIGTVKLNVGVGIKASMNIGFGNGLVREKGVALAQKVAAGSTASNIEPVYDSVTVGVSVPKVDSVPKADEGAKCEEPAKTEEEEKWFSLIQEETLDEVEEERINVKSFTRLCYPNTTKEFVDSLRKRFQLSLFTDISVGFNYYDALLEGGLFGGTQHHIVEPTIFPRRMELGFMLSGRLPYTKHTNLQFYYSHVIQDHDVWAQAKDGKTIGWGSTGIKISSKF